MVLKGGTMGCPTFLCSINVMFDSGLCWCPNYVGLMFCSTFIGKFMIEIKITDD